MVFSAFDAMNGRIHSRKDRHDGRRGPPPLGEVVSEENALRSNSIQPRAGGSGVSVAAEVIRSKRVDRNNQNGRFWGYRRLRLLCGGCSSEAEEGAK